MKKLAFLFVFILSPLCAALPPLYQNIKEIKSILDDPRMNQQLQSGEAILKIEKNEMGYLIVTTHHLLQVKINYLPSKKMGPVDYELSYELIK